MILVGIKVYDMDPYWIPGTACHFPSVRDEMEPQTNTFLAIHEGVVEPQIIDGRGFFPEFRRLT